MRSCDKVKYFCLIFQLRYNLYCQKCRNDKILFSIFFNVRFIHLAYTILTKMTNKGKIYLYLCSCYNVCQFQYYIYTITVFFAYFILIKFNFLKFLLFCVTLLFRFNLFLLKFCIYFHFVIFVLQLISVNCQGKISNLSLAEVFLI